MKNKAAKTITILVLLLAVAGGMLLAYKLLSDKPVEGAKAVTVEVLHLDGTVNTFQYQTDEEYLGALLTTQGLVSGEIGAYGLMVTTADGEFADETKNQWWTFTRDGEWVDTGVDTTVLTDGDHYEFSIYVG